MAVVKVPVRFGSISAAVALPERRKSKIRIDVSSLCSTGD